MVTFNVPPYTGHELKYITEAVASRKISGDGQFTKKCDEWLEKRTGTARVLLTTSCTHALEMAALLCGISAGDEVILPSYTFSSTANAFVLVGARLVFVDIRPDTMNIDEKKIENAITDKTKVIVVVHYAGVACEMDTIMDIACRHGLKIVEDAAQGVMSTYKGKALGTFGDFGCYSFHETKNYSMGEGGALLIRDANCIERAEILREKGTNRSKFFRGEIDKYTWKNYGSSYLPSELNAAYLWPQLLLAETINNDRLASWLRYYRALKPLADNGTLELPTIPMECEHNAHMFWIKTKNLEERTALMAYLKEREIFSMFHYVPLHTAEAGIKFGRFNGRDVYTTRESNRLTRLPMFYGLKENDIDQVVQAIQDFYNSKTIKVKFQSVVETTSR
jgi:dTDP-4-amino-4,6-dideoxygalactose transaminase